ncbi:MAG: 16S rRNA (adenine(1518)-N(6)/adenine(1519)-N(6))-dimethyltransferase RsmA [Thermodesulfobacteriota bacterium]
MPSSIKDKINPKDFFSRINSYPDKNLGQNFIKDLRVINRIADVAGLCEDDDVLEIGPGMGALTYKLSQIAKRVIAIEKDAKLYDHLSVLFDGYTNLELINNDALKEDFGALYYGNKLKVIANLPYSVSTPLLFKFLETRQNYSCLVLMLQLEVGERIAAAPGSKTYGSISVLLQTYADISTEFRVSPESFWPKPKVDSVVLKIVPLDTPRIDISDDNQFERIVRASFSSRRKMLPNSLESIMPKKTAQEALDLAGIDQKRRAETLTVKEFGILAEKLRLLGV